MVLSRNIFTVCIYSRCRFLWYQFYSSTSTALFTYSFVGLAAKENPLSWIQRLEIAEDSARGYYNSIGNLSCSNYNYYFTLGTQTYIYLIFIIKTRLVWLVACNT